MLEINRHDNIELLSYSEVKKVEGNVGNFDVTVEMQPRYIISEKCNGCGACAETCPIYIPNYFHENLGFRKTIDIAFGQAVPFIYDIYRDSCVE